MKLIDKAMKIRAEKFNLQITQQEVIDSLCPGNHGLGTEYMAFQRKCIKDCEKCWNGEVEQNALCSRQLD